MHIDSLAIEITRRCNMQCMHCLRGDAQNINMSNKVMLNILKDINSIWSLTISGGEPSLNPIGVRNLVNMIEHKKTEINNFYIVTNGKKYSPSLIRSLNRLYNYCDSNEISGLKVSRDEFHEDNLDPRIYDFEERFDFPVEIEKREGKSSPLNMGSAKENGLGERDNPVSEYYDPQDSTVYINVFGDVMLCCDLSYEEQKEHVIGNILKESLSNILERVALKQESVV